MENHFENSTGSWIFAIIHPAELCARSVRWSYLVGSRLSTIRIEGNTKPGTIRTNLADVAAVEPGNVNRHKYVIADIRTAFGKYREHVGELAPVVAG